MISETLFAIGNIGAMEQGSQHTGAERVISTRSSGRRLEPGAEMSDAATVCLVTATALKECGRRPAMSRGALFAIAPHDRDVLENLAKRTNSLS